MNPIIDRTTGFGIKRPWVAAIGCAFLTGGVRVFLWNHSTFLLCILMGAIGFGLLIVGFDAWPKPKK